MDVYNDNQLVRTRLEKEMLHITEENIDLTAAVIGVSKTILMDFHFAGNTLSIKRRSNKDILKIRRLATCVSLVTERVKSSSTYFESC